MVGKFIEAKEKALTTLYKEMRKGKVDKDLTLLLEKINKTENFFTTSSCSGRILLLEIPEIGDKKEARFIGKWHGQVTKHDLISKIKESKKGTIWLLAQPPVIHIGAKNLENAIALMKVANESGFKNTFIKSIGRDRVIIEICGTERMDAPIGEDGILTCNMEHLELLVKTANEVIKKSKNKLDRLERNLDLKLKI